LRRKPVIRIEGDGFDLIPLRRRHLPLTMAWRNADTVRVWFKTPDLVSSARHLRWYTAYAGKPDDFVFLIEDRESGALAGQISLYRVDRGRGEAEIGRLIAAPEFRGKGLMKRACARLIDYAFGVLGLRRLYLEVLRANEPAIRLYEKLGFRALKNDGKLLTMALSARRAS
jgi:RimJ/RimL family protein N-acetyltransferase